MRALDPNMNDTIWAAIGGYDSALTRARLAQRGIDDAVIAKKRKRGAADTATKNLSMGVRWPVERTNSWLSNYGQLRRNTNRKPIHRLAQLAFAVALLLAAKLIDWRNRRVTEPVTYPLSLKLSQ